MSGGSAVSSLARGLRRSHWLRQRVNMIRRAHAQWHEHRLGIDTITIPNGAVPATSRCADATWYDVMDYAALRRYLSPLCLTPVDVVVDVGCGMGRILCQCAQMNVAQCIGIEIDPALAERARANADALFVTTPIDIHCGDAAAFDYTPATVIVLFNPFGNDTMKRVLDSIRASLERKSRAVRIGYFNPACAHVFDAQPWLRFDGVCASPTHHYTARYWSSVD